MQVPNVWRRGMGKLAIGKSSWLINRSSFFLARVACSSQKMLLFSGPDSAGIFETLRMSSPPPLSSLSQSHDRASLQCRETRWWWKRAVREQHRDNGIVRGRSERWGEIRRKWEREPDGVSHPSVGERENTIPGQGLVRGKGLERMDERTSLVFAR